MELCMIVAGMLPAIAIIWSCAATCLLGAAVLGWRQAWWFRRRWRAAQAQQPQDGLNPSLEAQLLGALAESDRMRAELEAVFHTVQDALIVYSPTGEVRYQNAYSEQLFAPLMPYPQEERFHLVRVETLDGTPIPFEQTPLGRVLHGEIPQGKLAMVQRLRMPNAPPVVVAVQVLALQSAYGELVGALVVLRDITNEHRLARNNEIMRAVARACAGAIEEIAVAESALRVLLDGLGCTSGAVVVSDRDRPGYARSLAYRLDAMTPAARQRLLYLFNHAPISPDAPSQSLRVMASGAEFFGKMSLLGLPGEPSSPVYVFMVPLRCEGEIFGMLSVGFSPDRIVGPDEIDRELVRAAADEIAPALQRARLYEDARRLALIDPLTGLRNHRALQDLLRQELATGAAQGLPVSIVMLDLDHFRKFNETFGHEAGDRALREVAKAIQAQLRPGDTAARFGGEEFIVVLPATDSAHAAMLARRINQAVARAGVIINASGQQVHVTASLGFATFPVHASAPASLLKAADLALYAAKRAGRATVFAYAPDLLEESGILLPGGSAFTARDAGAIHLPSGADLETVQALITAIDLRDGYTAAHSEGVSRYAAAIGTEMNLPAEYVEVLRLGGLIHDVGKIGVPDQVLRKPGKLDDAEWKLMKAHTTMGEEILRPVEQLHHLLPLVRWHHERLDGSGYPDGLHGDEIPLLVRILSVADVFEAFTAERPYHPGRPAVEGLRLLQREAQEGKMDPYIVEVFEQILLAQGLIAESYAHGEQDLRMVA